jgi:hypothetical protein
MGKRSSFEKRARGMYLTPQEAIPPLLPFLGQRTTFYEPCAADGMLARMLEDHGHFCTGMSDIVPLSPAVCQQDAMDLSFTMASCFITNPPWDVAVMQPLLRHLMAIKPVWFLLYADWLFTRQAGPYWPHATHIVAIGRLKWIPDSPHSGKENACWVRFQENHTTEGPTFYGR